jgi:hypothetical protein
VGFVEGLSGETLYDVGFSDEERLDYCAKGEELERCGGWFGHCWVVVRMNGVYFDVGCVMMSEEFKVREEKSL